MFCGDFLGERFGKRPHLFLQGPADDRHINVNAARAACLRIASDVPFLQRIAHDQRGFQNMLELGAGRGVEIEVEVIRPVDVVAARVPGIQIDTAEVDDPKEAGKIVNHGKVDHIRGGMGDGTDRKSLGALFGSVFLEEKLTVRPVGIALHHHRAVDQVRQENGRYVGIVLQQVPLGDAFIGPEELLQMGELDGTPTHAKFNCRFAFRDFDRLRWPLSGRAAHIIL